MLYYAQGYFFQCIQGEYEIIIALYNKIIKDNRHNQIKLIQHKSIDKKCFSKWTMKYVNQNTNLNKYFLDEGLKGFQPHKLSEKMIDNFLNIILNEAESTPSMRIQGFMNRGYIGYF